LRLNALAGCVEPPKYSDSRAALSEQVSPYRSLRLHLAPSGNYDLTLKYMRELSAFAMGSGPDRSVALSDEIKRVFFDRFAREGDSSDITAVVDATIDPGMIWAVTTVRLSAVLRDASGREIATVSGEGQQTRPYIGGAGHPEIDGAYGLAGSAIADAARELAKNLDQSQALLAFARTNRPATQVASAPAAVPATLRFSEQPLLLDFHAPAYRPDDVAVIIGNADYSRIGRDIPNVQPAHADAESMRIYATKALGIRPENVILLKDATSAQLSEVFGTRDNPRGQLYSWVKPGKSRVFVYYSGHGAPGGESHEAMLVPTDASVSRLELSGFPLKTLFDNLGGLPTDGVTVVLDACFSGLSSGGNVLGGASPVLLDVKRPPVPPKLTLISAAASDQMANWESDGSHGLLTEYFLKGMSGEADKPPYGNGDGKVTLDKLKRYLDGTMTYWASRNWGRNQTAQILVGGQ